MHGIIECACVRSCVCVCACARVFACVRMRLRELAQEPVGASRSEICRPASLLKTQAGDDVAN